MQNIPLRYINNEEIMLKLTKKTAFYAVVIVQGLILIYLLVPQRNNNAILDFTRASLAWFYSNNEETNIVLNTTHVCNPLKPTITHKPGEVFLMVLALSKAYFEDNREVIRDTWASKKNKTDLINYVVFVIGCTPSVHLDHDVDREAMKHRDILRVDFQENQDPYDVKTLWSAYRWMMKYQPKFVIKTHHHVYVRLPRVIQWLKEPRSSGKLYAGKIHSHVAVNRDPKNQYFVSKKDYSSPTFPDYCSGAFYAFSGNLLKDLLALEKKVPKLNVEDAYFGVLMNKLEVEPTDIDNKLHIEANLGNDMKSWTNRMYVDVFVIGMNLPPSSLRHVHDRYKRLESS